MKNSMREPSIPFHGWSLGRRTEVPNAALDVLVAGRASLVEWRLWLTLYRRCAVAGAPAVSISLRDLARLVGTGRRNIILAACRLVDLGLLEHRAACGQQPGSYRIIPAPVGPRPARPALVPGAIADYLAGYLPPPIVPAGDPCPYCGAKDVPMVSDHVRPRVSNGADEPENLVYACVPCNAAKRDRSLLAFIADVGLV